jgi:hypothetical protein
MPDKQSRIIGKVGMGHIKILAVTHNGRIWIITGENAHFDRSTLLLTTCQKQRCGSHGKNNGFLHNIEIDD